MTFLLELTGEVGSQTFNAAEVRKQLTQAAGSPVDIMIDSFGGLLSEGLSISGALRDHGQVTAHLRGMIASAATIASMGAARISIAPEAMYLVHKVSLTFLDWASRNADELSDFIESLQHTKENLDSMDRAIAEIYAKRCKKPVKDLLELMKGERWISASEALEWGFVDEIQNNGNPDNSGNDDNSGKSGKSDNSRQSARAITAEQAAAITAAGLPLPPVAILQPNTKSITPNSQSNIFTRLANQLSTLLSNIMNPTQNTQSPNDPITQSPNNPMSQSQNVQNSPSQPAQNNMPLDPPAATSGTGATNNATAAAGNADQLKDQEIQRLKAEIEALKAQNAAAPGASTSEVKTQNQSSQNKDKAPATPFEAYIRTSQSAQALFDSIP